MAKTSTYRPSTAELDAVANRYNLENATAYEVMCCIWELDRDLRDERNNRKKVEEGVTQHARRSLRELLQFFEETKYDTEAKYDTEEENVH